MAGIVTHKRWMLLLITLQFHIEVVFCVGNCGIYHPFSNKPWLSDLLYINYMNGSTTVGSIAELVCKKGYRVDGPNYALCGSQGKWEIDDSTLRCARIECPKPYKIDIKNGEINTFFDRSNYLLDSVYWVTCNEGFEPNGTSVRRCLWDGTSGIWSQPIDKYGEKVLVGGDIKPTCMNVTENVQDEIKSNNIETSYDIVTWFSIVCHFIGFIGTMCVISFTTTISRFSKDGYRSHGLQCGFQRFIQGLLLATIYFLLPIVVFCKICNMSSKNDKCEDSSNIPLEEKKKGEITGEQSARIEQLEQTSDAQCTETGQFLVETNEQPKQTKVDQSTEREQVKLTNDELSAKINNLALSYGDLSKEFQKLMCHEHNSHDQAEHAPWESIETHETSSQSLSNLIDQLTQKVNVLLTQLQQFTKKYRIQLSQSNKEDNHDLDEESYQRNDSRLNSRDAHIKMLEKENRELKQNQAKSELENQLAREREKNGDLVKYTDELKADMGRIKAELHTVDEYLESQYLTQKKHSQILFTH